MVCVCVLISARELLDPDVDHDGRAELRKSAGSNFGSRNGASTFDDVTDALIPPVKAYSDIAIAHVYAWICCDV